jgi:Uma2 family endonuclease
MSVPKLAVGFTFEDYLAWEETQLEKHEFVRGKVFAMGKAAVTAGVRREHVTVSLNLASAFKSHLRGTGCRAYMSDMKLRVEAADVSFYPDVVVTCNQQDHTADIYLSHPILVVEVLSESTAAYDRGDKFAGYRKLDSLQEYVLVDITHRRVEIFRRNTENRWELYEFSGAENVDFASIELVLPLAVVFEDIEPATEAV